MKGKVTWSPSYAKAKSVKIYTINSCLFTTESPKVITQALDTIWAHWGPEAHTISGSSV